MGSGAVLALGVLTDIFFTTLHPDVEGKLAEAVQRTCWKTAVALGNRLTGIRRQLLAFAGPFMVGLTFVTWVLLFIVGVALIVWPNLGLFRSEPEFDVLTFFDALYYAGVTVSVLGYGDISPTDPRMQTVAWVASAAGFGMLTAIVAYILELVSSVDERNRLALQVHDETGGTERGVQLVLRHATAGTDELYGRYTEWAGLTRQVQDKLHRYALTSLFYRSRDPAYDPEATLRVLGEAVAAGYLLTADPTYEGLRPGVEQLDLATSRLMGTIAAQYLGTDVMSQMEDPQVSAGDRRWVQEMATVMAETFGSRWDGGALDPSALAIAARLRHFLTALADLTVWSEHQGPLPTADVDHHRRSTPKGVA